MFRTLDGHAVEARSRTIAVNGAPMGVVLEQDMNELAAPLAAFGTDILIRTLMVALFAVAVSIVVARRLTNRIQSLAASVATIADGDHQTPVPQAETADEIGAIAKAVDHFRTTLAEAELAAEHRRRQSDRQGAAMAELKVSLLALSQGDLDCHLADDPSG